MKRNIIGCVLLAVCLNCSVTFALAPIGQPTSNLRKGWWSAGVDVSTSNIELTAENIDNMSFFTDGDLEDYKIDLLLGKAGYGIKDNWEVFVGLGVAKTDFGGSWEKYGAWGESGSTQTDKFEIDGDMGQVLQLGTKATFYERALLKAGVMCQLTWLNMTGTLEHSTYKDSTFIASAEREIETNMMVFQLASGLSYQLSLSTSIYGGPLVQYVFGDMESTGQSGYAINTSGSFDIKGEASFGGWVGLRADIDLFTSLNLEYQMTGSSGTIGFNLTSKF